MKTVVTLSILFLFASCGVTTEFYDILIINAQIVDGTGNPWFRGDIGIRSDRIAAIGRLRGSRASRIIDAAGKVVSPGFIDMLGQSELSLLFDGRAMSKISQGITTEVTGEGNSAAPEIGRAHV